MWLLRHGETEFNARFKVDGIDPGIPDAELTAVGRRQCGKAAQTLGAKNPALILASPYTRALQTAEIVAQATGAPIVVEPLVCERFLYSCDVGSPASALRRAWPSLDFNALTDEIWWPSRQETHASLMRRVRLFREKWEACEESSRLVVVTHWYFIQGLLGHPLDNGELRRI